ncbi:MAG: xanthan lyase [Muribaculaceae bacterium]|nr:xanthan lyase [Muribaculaceae bacterium]
MKFRRFLYILIAVIVAAACFDATESYAAKKRSKGRTTSVSKRSSSKSKSRKKRYSRKSSKSSRRQPAPVAPPPEVPSNDSLTLAVNDKLMAWIPSAWNPGGLRVNSVKRDSISRIARVSLNENFTYLPVTRELIDSLSRHVTLALPDSLADYRVTLNVGQRSLAYYINKVDKLPEQFRKNPPFVVEANPYIHPTKGLENDIIALWHSHGRYYKTGGWCWQRPFLFQSVEDTYTMSYVLPFLVPMLENAGAYVMLPRERDTNPNEVIVDNDTNESGQIFSQPYYKEMTGSKPWITGDLDGFIYDLPDFRDTENPFENGTYRQTQTVTSGKPSVAAWYADIPEDGEYAVYISYKSFPNSAEDAHYTVNYSGGSKEFRVNQTMGGGTWIYLGTFPLTKGYSDKEPIVTLSNISENADRILTADAVKIGGGMGNIARSERRSDVYYDPSTPEIANANDEGDDEGDDEESDEENDTVSDDKSPETPDSEPASTSMPADPTVTGASAPSAPASGRMPSFRTSGMPRFLEGARYWLHWAGFPENVYSPYHGNDDYKDDYTSRGHWVNYLAGGSRVLPNHEGLNIPVDMAFALHSDAGKRADDSFVGTLGIYFSQNGDSYRDGTPRINSRMLTDLIMRQITGDIRRQYEPSWTRRSMWDKSYVEARVPEVPTTLIELLSHQNFADMMYGLDPGFRFTVSRAIYKGIARFLGERKDREVVIQPLPVKDFAITRENKNHYRLSWQPTPDPIEETAMPDKYIILGRNEGELGFHKIGETTKTHYELKVADNEIHSFRVVAANAGGLSFPSETLAMREAPGDKDPVLIINGFTRVSGPEKYIDGNYAGFKADSDFGVPYLRDISFTGPQMEFNRNAGNAFGQSSNNQVTQIIAGNTFDYPALHGKSIAKTAHGFVSASVGAVESGNVKLNNYKAIDLILGRQKAGIVGNGKSGINHRTFTPELERQLQIFSDHGGKLMITGENVVSDLQSAKYGADDRHFSEVVMGVVPDTIAPSRSGTLRSTTGHTVKYSSTYNKDNYIVQHPDPLTLATVV